MIRQAISCDICGTEKRQTNHWFVAWEHAGELRVSGWNPRTRLRPNARHLCGQACLHKLADDFMERIISRRTQTSPTGEQESKVAPPTETGASSSCHRDDCASSARIVTTASAQHDARPTPTLISMSERLPKETAPTPQEPPRYASRSWHAEAWQRERERTMQAPDRRPETAARRISKV